MGFASRIVSAFVGTPARRQTVKVMFLVAVALTAVTTVQQWFYWPLMGRPMPVGILLLSALPSSLYWVAATPLAIGASIRWPLRESLATDLLGHTVLVAGLLVPHLILLAVPIWIYDNMTAGGLPFWPFVASAALSSRSLLGVGCYGGAIVLHRSLETVRSLEAGRAQAAQLEAELAQAQLRALQMQIQPHFLFNTLQAIRTLIAEDPASAMRTVTLLGDLLRLTLAKAGDPVVPLRQELQFLNGYLEIERVRLGDRLAVTIDVPRDLLDVPLPSFLLQPLVENAIKHGISERREPGRVEIRARSENGYFELSVRNDGPPLTRMPRPGGIGLATTGTRLARQYGGAASLELADDQAGVRATVRIPISP